MYLFDWKVEIMELHFLKTVWSDIIILKNHNEIAIIDTGFEKQYASIKKYLDKMNIKKISFILLTHFHRDHYGSILNIIKNYSVDKVYFKDYSALDKTTASGTLADDQYRLEEYNKCIKLKKDISRNSKLVAVEGLNSIPFGKYELRLYNTSNSMKEIYEDKKYESSYHKILFNENQNSIAVFLKVNGVNIFFGGDIFDTKSIHPKSEYINYQIASSINKEIDIYKVPHHGTIHCNSEKTLDIYKPKIAIITNGKEYLEKESTIYKDLKRANKDVEILLTEEHTIVLKISEDGCITKKLY